LNRYETDSDSEFTLDYDMTSSSSTEPTLIGVDTDVPSGGIASVLWTGLNYLTTYSWYAIAYDTQGAFRQSDTWNFTTAEFNMPPIASFTENATIVFTYDVIHFDASDSYDPDGTIIDYFWDFGDGTNATGITVDHSYANNGTYIVTLTVTDDKGMTASTNASKIVLNKPDIAVEHIAFSKSVVGQGYTIQINVTVANQGDFIETFNVTLYANTTAIETREITLTSLNSTTITYTWNTNGFVKGNYTLWAC
jgi:PKD repeat protein